MTLTRVSFASVASWSMASAALRALAVSTVSAWTAPQSSAVGSSPAWKHHAEPYKYSRTWTKSMTVSMATRPQAASDWFRSS
ncbi:hypothetical protein ACH4OW_34970 [Streptomyces sp. NPDC017056]|uniref:hypothetical protein n=1 Tax=Streptomyces sp. NPDC017056 TaxID=3364973 RepID=UPI0037941914